ncbi:hypothetical protein RHCH11_RHCH11_00503 [Beijerinckiaceae bacterium RH CH11]|nr:hypothetical protein RHAL8_00501 [Beijerinckiaceae bacterium RH AL8]VVB43072.1 hypothetical protein RHCH11_RHCH11_00503 [Beijerinckiaceae bacterium RH CH11]
MAGPVGFNEMMAGGETRLAYERIARWLSNTPKEYFATRRGHAELMFRRIGITFNVYGDKEATERLIPFDIIPRVIQRSEWNRLEAGLVQRVKALNAFLGDVYGKQEIVRAGLVPRELIESNPAFRREMVGVKVPHGVYIHIAGIDVVRIDSEDFYVLEDNVRTPSGVSYMLENREVMMRVAPDLFAEHRVAPVENYPDALLGSLRSVNPDPAREPTIAVLTPGPFNSAYYEHSFLADKLGVELVEGRDLIVDNDTVYMRTTEGPKRVDVIYRRIDDDFLDPEFFKPESILGVPGIMRAYQAGNITIANAVGTGIADDKAIYTFMPEIIEFYLGEPMKLKNVQTWRCREPDSLKYVLEHLGELVVKEVNGSGGYGMLVGPHATKEQIEAFAEKLKADPANFIAQPTLSLSTCPTYFDSGVAPRHVDLRPFVLTGSDGVRVVPGGLTRVALKEGSLVVNSSQGGGTKDTWIVDDADGTGPGLASDLPPAHPIDGRAARPDIAGQSQNQTQG